MSLDELGLENIFHQPRRLEGGGNPGAKRINSQNINTIFKEIPLFFWGGGDFKG